MGKCSFKFQDTQVNFEESESKSDEEVYTELDETLVKILQKPYWRPRDEVCDLLES